MTFLFYFLFLSYWKLNLLEPDPQPPHCTILFCYHCMNWHKLNYVHVKSTAVLCNLTIVGPRSTDLPKNGQPRYSGQTQNYGWISYWKLYIRSILRWGPSEFRTTDRTEFPLLLQHTKSASLNGHSLTHIKFYYSLDNFIELIPHLLYIWISIAN